MNLNEYKILKLMHEKRKPLFFRNISKISGVSIGGTQQVLKDYANFTTKKKEGRNTYYSLKNNLETFYLKTIIEVKKIQKFIIKNKLFKEFLEYFIHNNIPCLIFGSYAKGSFKKDSDMDILILSSKNAPEHLCPTEIHTIRLTKKQFKKAIKKNEPLINEIKKNHILISSIDYFTLALGEKNE